jgi:hypothetical protein
MTSSLLKRGGADGRRCKQVAKISRLTIPHYRADAWVLLVNA